MNEWQYRRGARVVQRGGLIAYPTEAVFGLGCDPSNRAAVERLVRLKQRGPGQGFIIIAASFSQIAGWIRFPNLEVRARVEATWPGPVSWVVPTTPRAPSWLQGHGATMAVRITDFEPVRRLCQLAGPLVSTSANRRGQPPLRDALRVRAVFGAEVDWVVPGSCGGQAGPSELRRAVDGQILRAAISPAH